jgi:hypothetical protein
MTKHCFIVTSAVNTKWGIYDNETRFKQTIATLDSIHKYAPNSKIIIMECGAIPLTEWQTHILEGKSDLILYWTNDYMVQHINDQSKDESLLKNFTEIRCFSETIEHCLKIDILNDVDRIHKISGRYTLNEHFSLDLYENNQKIVVGPKAPSKISLISCPIKFEYPCRFWSWPKSMSNEIITIFNKMLPFLMEHKKIYHVSEDGEEFYVYMDLEHLLYHFLDPNKLQSVFKVGLNGNLSNTGDQIND